MRVQDTTLSAEQRAEALKFIVHFVGDVHQPLHDENLKLGGNEIDILWDGKKQNLHHSACIVRPYSSAHAHLDPIVVLMTITNSP